MGLRYLPRVKVSSSFVWWAYRLNFWGVCLEGKEDRLQGFASGYDRLVGENKLGGIGKAHKGSTEWGLGVCFLRDGKINLYESFEMWEWR